MPYYAYTICHPDDPDIEYPEEKLTAEQVRELVKNYPWRKELKKCQFMEQEREKLFTFLPRQEPYYNPSLEFTNLSDERKFTLTAGGDPDDYLFSVWYERPVMIKVLFGLLGEKEIMDVIYKEFSKEDAFRLLEKFLRQYYDALEDALSKKEDS